MYTEKNFKSKKELKTAVKLYNEWLAGNVLVEPRPVTCYSPGPFPCPTNGIVALEGPHYPKPHTWYASATIVNGIVTKVS